MELTSFVCDMCGACCSEYADRVTVMVPYGGVKHLCRECWESMSKETPSKKQPKRRTDMKAETITNVIDEMIGERSLPPYGKMVLLNYARRLANAYKRDLDEQKARILDIKKQFTDLAKGETDGKIK